MDTTGGKDSSPTLTPRAPRLLSSPGSLRPGQGLPGSSDSHCSRKRAWGRSGDGDPTCPLYGAHLSSPAAQTSSLDHRSQSSLPDLAHIKEGKETGKGTAREEGSENRNPGEPGEGQRRRGPGTEPWRKREAKTKTREREKANETEDRDRTSRDPKEKHAPCRPLAWAEGRSRPLRRTSQRHRSRGSAARAQGKKLPPGPHPLAPALTLHPLPALFRPQTRFYPSTTASPTLAPGSAALLSFLSWTGQNTSQSFLDTSFFSFFQGRTHSIWKSPG